MSEPIAEPHRPERRAIVGVMGSGVEPFDHLAAPVGRLIARLGHHLLTGAGGGVMTSAARAFSEVEGRRGVVIGIVRADPATRDRYLGEGLAARSYRPARPPNPYVDLPIFTHLPDSGETGRATTSRNHINVLTSNVVVVLPGGAGTLSELQLALEYGRPAVVFVAGERVGGLSEPEVARRFSAATVVGGLVGLEGALLEALA